MSTILFILTTIISLGGNPFVEECQVYPLSAEITDLNYKDDIVTFTDYHGEEWTYYGCEDWEIGDGANLIMYNNMTTDSIYDDIILTIKYENKKVN